MSKQQKLFFNYSKKEHLEIKNIVIKIRNSMNYLIESQIPLIKGLVNWKIGLEEIFQNGTLINHGFLPHGV